MMAVNSVSGVYVYDCIVGVVVWYDLMVKEF